MSSQTLSRADSLFVGSGYDPMLADSLGRAGVPVSPLTMVSFGTPALADADFVIKAATSTELPNAETVTYTPATDGTSPLDSAAVAETITLPDGSTDVVFDVRDGASYGRNLVSVVTHASSVVAMTILISGYDYLGRAMSELHTVTATGTSKTVTGTKAFAYVSDVAITSAGNAEANTLNLGNGAKLGVPFKIEKIGHVLSASIGGVQELINVASNATVVAGDATTATTATGDVRGTITFTTALDGSKEPMALIYVSGRNSKTGLVGVTQA